MIKTSPCLFLILCCALCDDPSRKLDSYDYFSEFYAIVFTPDGKSLLTSHPTGDIKIWNLAASQKGSFGKSLDDDINRDSGWIALAVSPDGRYLVGGGPKDKVRFWHINDPGKKTVTLGSHTRVKAVAFSRDDKTLLTGGEDQVVKVWNLETKTSRDVQHDHPNGISAITISADGKAFATADDDQIKIWDMATMKERLTITRRQPYGLIFNALAFSPDGKSIASICRENVKLWSATTGKELASVSVNYPTALAFSPDGKRIALSGAYTKIFVYDGTMSKQEMELDQGISPAAISLAFSPDGSLLVSGHCSDPNRKGGSGIMQLWNMKTTKP